MRPKVILLLFLSAFTTLVFGQDRVFLTFPSEGEREVWIGTGLPSEPPKDSVRTKSVQLDLATGSRAANDTVFVWDKQTGNLASKNLGEVKKVKTWPVKPEDYIDIAQVQVKVESGGKAVAAANVSLDDGRRETSQLAEAATNGEAVFFAIKPGKLTVSVKYRTEKGMADPVVQILDAPLKREAPVPTLTVALPAGVATAETNSAAPTPTGKPESGATEQAPDSPRTFDPGVQPANPIGTIVGMLIVLGLIGGGVYFLLQYVKKNPNLVGGKLEELGVQIPKPGDDDPVPSAPIAPLPKPAPPQKILLDDAPLDPILPSAPVAVASTGVPKLIGDGGDAMNLPDGETVVGREAGLGLSLIGESTVSRRHAQLVRNGVSVVVRDLGSTNGTFVNGVQVQGDVALRPGDNVQFGAIRFRYEG